MEEVSLSYILLFPSATLLLSALLRQNQFGRNGEKCPRDFCLFLSETKNLLFNDNTECLARLQGKNTYQEYLGSAYVTAVGNLRQCSSSRKCDTPGKPARGKGGEVAGLGGILGVKMGIKKSRRCAFLLPWEVTVSLTR